MLPESALLARANFIGWLKWYLAVHPEVAKTPAALARKLRISKGALHQLMDEKSQRLPRLETILAAEELTGMSVAVLLHDKPPPIPSMSR